MEWSELTGMSVRINGHIGPNQWVDWTELLPLLFVNQIADPIVDQIICRLDRIVDRNIGQGGPKYWPGWTEILARMDRIWSCGKPHAQIPRTHVYRWAPSSPRNCYTWWTKWLDRIGLPTIRSTNCSWPSNNSVHELKWAFQQFGPRMVVGLPTIRSTN